MFLEEHFSSKYISLDINKEIIWDPCSSMFSDNYQSDKLQCEDDGQGKIIVLLLLQNNEFKVILIVYWWRQYIIISIIWEGLPVKEAHVKDFVEQGCQSRFTLSTIQYSPLWS